MTANAMNLAYGSSGDHEDSRSRQGSSVGMDQLTKKMILILRRHGRSTVSDIAREPGITRQQVASRVNPLFQSAQLRVIAAPQPIVENAFVHGVAKSHGSARVQIEAYKEGDKICMIVSDNGRGFSSTAIPRSGIGLSNTEARLSCLYGSDHELRCGEGLEEGARVTIRFKFATTREKMLV